MSGEDFYFKFIFMMSHLHIKHIFIDYIAMKKYNYVKKKFFLMYHLYKCNAVLNIILQSLIKIAEYSSIKINTNIK